MDLGGEASGGLEMGDNWGGGGGGLNDQAIWATEDEYRNWNATMSMSNSNYNTSGPPPNKKTRSSGASQSQSHSGDSRSKAIGKMFYKTKLCCKYRAGVCPYITNCNFAHGLEELRKPPPNWQDIVAAHEETVEQREEHQIPTITTTDSRNESQRSYKGRHCKKFYTEEGCPYGDTCTFLHDEQSRARESVAISVSPSLGPPSSAPCHKPSNWKTRICNKWETTGTCPFGTKCHFAHGFTELHKYGGGLMDGEGGRDSSVPAETKQASMPIKTADTSVATSLTAPRPDFHQVGLGIPSQRPSSVTQVVGQRPLQKWKGPDKISRIYGDWIDDFE